MLWFFVIPCVLFLGWASYKLILSLNNKKPQNLVQKIESLKQAKSKNSRWQSAYSLSQSIFSKTQKQQLSDADKNLIFKELSTLISQDDSEDPRLNRYILLTLSQIQHPQTLPLFETFSQSANPDLSFYAAWGLAKTLEKHTDLATSKHFNLAKQWLSAKDPSLKKLAGSFILNFFPHNRHSLLPLLKDSHPEVRWNTAIGLSQLGYPEGLEIHAEIFNLKSLRAANFKTLGDLSKTLQSAYAAAKQVNNPLINKKIEDLKNTVSPNTPEGKAIILALPTP